MVDAGLAARLRREIEEHEAAIDRIVADAAEVLERAGRETPGVLHSRALGSALQDFYSAVEDVFEKIAPVLNGGLPESRDWHARLLHDMTLDLPGVRPPVIDADTEVSLRAFLRFRHRARNIYGYELEGGRLRQEADALPDAARRFKACLGRFYGFLDATRQP